MPDRSPVLVRRVVTIQIATVALALVVTLVATFATGLDLDHRSAGLHAAIDTAATLVSLLAAYLLGGRFRYSRRLEDLLLFGALLGLSLAGVAALIGLATSADDTDHYLVWITLTLRLVSIGLFVAAAFASERTIDEAPRTAAALRRGSVALAVAIIAFAVLQPRLSTGIDPMLAPSDPGHPTVIGSPGFIAVQLTILVLLVVGAVGFTLRTRRSGDEFMGWLAVGLTLGAFARVNFILFPSNFTDWVFAGDVLRLGFFLAILIGALRQIRDYQRSAAEAAVLAERQRIARDLHDTVAQDLAFIVARGHELGRMNPDLERIAGVAENALASSRATIVAYSATPEEPLGTAIGRLAAMLASRSGCRLTLDLQEDVRVPRAAHDSLVRIVSEAISNAVRHARPSELTVSLRAGDEIRLAVADDGVGLDSARVGSGSESVGFGLSSMTQRAEVLGGSLALTPRDEGGTLLEVVIPTTGLNGDRDKGWFKRLN